MRVEHNAFVVHARGITAVPSDEDGKDTLLRPRNFQIAVAYRLGIHVLGEMTSLALCAAY